MDEAHLIRTPKGVFRIFTAEELYEACRVIGRSRDLPIGEQVRVMNVHTGKCEDFDNREAALKAIGAVPNDDPAT